MPLRQPFQKNSIRKAVPLWIYSTVRLDIIDGDLVAVPVVKLGRADARSILTTTQGSAQLVCFADGMKTSRHPLDRDCFAPHVAEVCDHVELPDLIGAASFEVQHKLL